MVGLPLAAGLHGCTPGASSAEAAVLEAISARMQRQEALADHDREFRLVMMEAAFSNLICSSEEMVAQIRRVREVAKLDHVNIGIVPADAKLGVAPYHGFAMMDDRLVMVDLFNTAISSSGRSDVATYRRVFDEFESEAVADINPILDRYQRIYAELSIPSPST